jgi:hypothetical protein
MLPASESGFGFEIGRIIFDGETEFLCGRFDGKDEIWLKCEFNF